MRVGREARHNRCRCCRSEYRNDCSNSNDGRKMLLVKNISICLVSWHIRILIFFISVKELIPIIKFLLERSLFTRTFRVKLNHYIHRHMEIYSTTDTKKWKSIWTISERHKKSNDHRTLLYEATLMIFSHFLSCFIKFRKCIFIYTWHRKMRFFIMH